MSSVHVQELRGHYVRRLPTSDEISTRSPIVLTERDRQLLVAVHQHGFLTTDLVELAFFPPHNGSSRQRLRRLMSAFGISGCGATSSASSYPSPVCSANVCRSS